MSTHKTEHFGLHKWESGDDFLRSEFNENFAKLDAAVKVVTGQYIGDGVVSRTIELGFTPKAVLLIGSSGYTNSNDKVFGGLALPGFPTLGSASINTSSIAIAIVEGGFMVRDSGSVCTNWSDRRYHYMALV